MNRLRLLAARRRVRPSLEPLESRTVPATLEFVTAPAFTAETTVRAADRTETLTQSRSLRTSLQAINVQLARVNISPINAVSQISTFIDTPFAFPDRDPLARFWNATIRPTANVSFGREGSWDIITGTVSELDATDYGAPVELRIVPDSPEERDGDPVIVQISTGVRITTLPGDAPGVSGTTTFRAFADVGSGYEQTFTRTYDAQDLIRGEAEEVRKLFTLSAEIGQTIRVGATAEQKWRSSGASGDGFDVRTGVVIGASVTRPPDLSITAADVMWNVDRRPTPELFDRRGLDFRYRLDRATLTQDTEVGFFWASGPGREHVISEASEIGRPRPVIPADQRAGTSEFFNVPAHWGRPPQGTTHVLVVLDPDDRIAESDETNNVAALPLRSPAEILNGSVTFNVSQIQGNIVIPMPNGMSLTGRFVPGAGLSPEEQPVTMSEAEVSLGVDHFNWIQMIEAFAPGETITNPLLGRTLSAPIVDPFLRGRDVNANLNELEVRTPRRPGQVFTVEDFAPDEFVFYFNEVVTSPEDKGVPIYATRTTPTRLEYLDTPVAPPGAFAPAAVREGTRFHTYLVGVDRNRNPIELPVRLERFWQSDTAPGPDGALRGGVFNLRDTRPPSGGDLTVGPGPGGEPVVRLLNTRGDVLVSVKPFEDSFTGGIRTAVGDLTADGLLDFVAAAGPGHPPTVVVYGGFDGEELRRFDAFESGFTGGLFVTMADFNGDGIADLVVSPDEGGGPRVRIFDGETFEVIADFFGIEDPDFRGGVRVGTGDLNGDGTVDLLVGAGFGGGPRLALFDGRSLTSDEPVKLIPDFFVFEPTLRNGVFVTAGDITGDGAADLIVGAGPGGGPRVFALDGRDLIDGETTQVANFFAGDPSGRDGIRVAARDLSGDGVADLIVGAGPNVAPRVTTYAGRDIPADGTPPASTDFFAFDPAFLGGLFVG